MLSPSERARLTAIAPCKFCAASGKRASSFHSSQVCVNCNGTGADCDEHLHAIAKALADLEAAERENNHQTWLADKRLEERAIRAERERDALREAARWIPVSERLPDSDYDVLVYADGFILISRAVCGRWVLVGQVTHWQPLPATPKEQTR
jgi:hypothetical protein